PRECRRERAWFPPLRQQRKVEKPRVAKKCPRPEANQLLTLVRPPIAAGNRESMCPGPGRYPEDPRCRKPSGRRLPIGPRQLRMKSSARNHGLRRGAKTCC